MFLGCLYTYGLDNDERILFISPKFFNGGFPSEQKCTWRFVAREKESKVHITFLETHIREGDSISIRNGWSSGSVVGKIDPKNPFDPNGYASQNNFLLVEFNSKSSLTPGIHHPKGFRGIFKIISNEGKNHCEKVTISLPYRSISLSSGLWFALLRQYEAK